MIDIKNDWFDFFEEEKKKDYFIKLRDFIYKEYEEKIIFPKKEEIFNAFKITERKNIKVVIVGQDPYYKPYQAMGLAFSVRNGEKMTPSLRNIFKEIANEFNINYTPLNGDLTKWAEQGVFLLNTILTVQKNNPLSHKNFGWEIFTNNVIKKINEDDNKKVFMLWGNNAKEKSKLINKEKHLVLESGHPSPLSFRFFYGNNHFIKANEYLESNNIGKVNWTI